MSSTVEARVSFLESIMKELAYAQLRTEQSLQEFKDEMKVFKDEMKVFKDEMKVFKNEMLEFKDGVEDSRSEMQHQSKNLNRKWGELANRLGTIVEDIVAPNMPGVLARYFNVDEPDLLMVRARKKHPTKPGLRREFDVIVITPQTLYLNETKATIRQEYLERFAANYREVFEFFPEYAHLKLVPIMSSLYLPDEAVRYLSGQKIYAMMMADDSMDIVNFADVS